MPIKIPDALPARSILEQENIFVMTEFRAAHQDIRPLRILILNLMPTKITTETQLLRALSNTPLQIEFDLLKTATHLSKNTSSEHRTIASVCVSIEEVASSRIITGGSATAARAMAISWRWPCERLAPLPVSMV